MGYKRLEDYIATLSESEKEQYEYLIEESRQRSLRIKKNCDESRKYLEGLHSVIKGHDEVVVALKTLVQKLDISIVSLNWEALSCAKSVFQSMRHKEHLFQHYSKSLN